MNNNFVYGRKPVLEALQQRPDEIEKVFIRNNLPSSSVQDVKDICSEYLVPVSKVPQIKLENLVGRVNDQGIVALLSPIKYTNFFDWVQNNDLGLNPAVLILDGIEDPHNFGAILRTAAASGISAVLVPEQGQSPVTAVAFKASAGTAGRIPIIRIHNARQGLKDLQIAGFEVYALDGNAKQTLWEQDMNKPIAFLIGNEGRGLDSKDLKKCTGSITIPMVNEVESLNASVSAALVCYEWHRKKLGV